LLRRIRAAPVVAIQICVKTCSDDPAFEAWLRLRPLPIIVSPSKSLEHPMNILCKPKPRCTRSSAHSQVTHDSHVVHTVPSDRAQASHGRRALSGARPVAHVRRLPSATATATAIAIPRMTAQAPPLRLYMNNTNNANNANTTNNMNHRWISWQFGLRPLVELSKS